MEPIANLEEKPDKVVGKVPHRTPAEFLERMAALYQGFGLKLPYPKGVHRFKTFEEANEWEMKHQIAAAVKRSRPPTLTLQNPQFSLLESDLRGGEQP